jgi:hypothetical protein
LAVNGLQLHCCGATGPRDWSGSKYNKAGRTALDLAVTAVAEVYSIPASCCRDGTSDEICKVAVKTGIGAQISNVIYSEVGFHIAFDSAHSGVLQNGSILLCSLSLKSHVRGHGLSALPRDQTLLKLITFILL